MIQQGINTFFRHTIQWHIVLIGVFVFGLIGCASGPESMPESVASEDTAAPAVAVSADGASDSTTSSDAVAAESTVESVAEIAAPPKVVESCKTEAYVGYEKNARESISMGWAASQEGRFGVGFRNADEYKKWSNTHNALFAKVSDACQALTQCAKDNAKDKETQCADLANRFSQWQQSAKHFTDLVKAVESTQPPELCSMQPMLDDPSRCFTEIAEQISKHCQSEECRETSLCWSSISYMDDAIRQAEHACGFARQALDKCRGYIEATTRRNADFDQCTQMHKALNLDFPPVF